MLRGKRTYIVCGVAIVWAIVGLIFNWIESTTAIEIILGGLAGAGLRAGVAAK